MIDENESRDEPARGVGVGQRDEAELGGAVQDQVLGEAAHVQHNHAGGEEELDDEVPITNLQVDQESCERQGESVALSVRAYSPTEVRAPRNVFPPQDYSCSANFLNKDPLISF
jgi:hypothetical protein